MKTEATWEILRLALESMKASLLHEGTEKEIYAMYHTQAYGLCMSLDVIANGSCSARRVFELMDVLEKEAREGGE